MDLINNKGDRDKYGNTALILASGDGDCNMVKMLLENGADIEAINERGTTALIRASEYGKYDVVKILLENGADPGNNVFLYYIYDLVIKEEIKELMLEIYNKKKNIKPARRQR